MGFLAVSDQCGSAFQTRKETVRFSGGSAVRDTIAALVELLQRPASAAPPGQRSFYSRS
jgi:hypothetical protein